MQESADFLEILILVIIRGLPTTLLLTLSSLAIGLLIGIGLALARVYGSEELQFIAKAYENILRGIPLLVLLFLFGTGLTWMFAFVGEGINALTMAAIFSLAIRSAAYQSQIFRGAILSVDPGQMLAAQALGMNKLQATRHVILPQAFRLSLPGWANEYAVVIKDSSLAMGIGVHEMVWQNKTFSFAYPALFMEIMIIVTVIYFMFTYPVTRIVGERMTKKLRELGLGGGKS